MTLLAPTARVRSLAAIIACITVVGMALGSSIPLLALAMERQGLSSTLIGLNTATPALATLALTPFIPALLRRMPTLSLLYLCILISALVMPAYYLLPNLWLWFVLRFLNGLAITGLFVVSEFWINNLADEKNRGRLIGIYGTILSAGFATGPIVLYLTGVDGLTPFIVISGLSLLAGLPLMFVHGLAPRITEKPRHRFTSFFFAAPAATLAALVYGATETDIFNMLPIYAVRIGMTEQSAIFVLTLFAAGNIFCQIPLGLIADRIDRRLVLLGCAVTGFIGAALLPVVSGSFYLFAPTLFIFGGVVAGLYTVGLTLLGERFRGADLAAANGAFVMMYSTGALLGPPLAGAAMDIWDPHGAALAIALLCGLYLLIAGRRFLASRP